MDGNEDHMQGGDLEPRRCNKRTAKPTPKKAAQQKENVDAQAKKIEQLNQELRRLKKSRAKQITSSDDEDEDEDDEGGKELPFESEEETETSGFSSAIFPLATITSNTATPHTNRTALKRVGAAAARMPSQTPRISSNAYKTLQAPPNPAGDEDDEDSSNDQAPMAAPAQIARPQPHRDFSQSQELSAELSSPCVNHISAVRNRRARSSSVSPPAGDGAPAPKKAKSRGLETLTPLMPMFREGAEVNVKKPRASDYVDVVHALILRAAAEYECYISTKDAFPDTATRNKWAKVCWKNAGLAAGENYVLTDAINLLLRSRGSRIRGHAVTNIRPLLMSILGFKRSGEPKTVAGNVSLFTTLKKNSAFHFKNSETLSGFAQGKIISAVLNAVWFEDKCSQGIVFEALFSPVPFSTLALIFTIIDFCLDEWSTGNFVKATLWEKDVLHRHRVFQLDLEEWDKLNNAVVLGHRKKLYIRAARHAGVIQAAKVQQTLVGEALDRVRNEMEGRTGETDSEAEE